MKSFLKQRLRWTRNSWRADSRAFQRGWIFRHPALAFFNLDRFVQTFGYTHDDVPTLQQWWVRAHPDEKYRRWVGATWEAAVQRAAVEGRALVEEDLLSVG